MTKKIYSLNFLLIILPIASRAIYGMDQQENEKGDADVEFIRAALIAGMEELRNPGWVYEKEKENGRDLESKKGHSKWKTCYEEIRVFTTPKCSPLQSTDFSNMRVSDFCIGGSVSFGGSINFRVGMSMPSTLTVNVSRAPDDLQEYSRSSEIRRGTGINNFVIYLDGCDILALLMCPYISLRWCGCPIKEEVLILDQTRLPAERDFLPMEMGFGSFIAHVTLSTPEDTVCVYLVFSRKRIRSTNHFSSLNIHAT